MSPKGKWQRRDDITPDEVMAIIREYGAPTTSEIKMILRTDSQSVRSPLAALWGANKIFVMPAYNGIVFIEVTGSFSKGRPNPTAIRKERGKGTPRQEGIASKTKRAVRLETDTDRSTPYTVEEFTRKLSAIEGKNWSDAKKARAKELLAERSPWRQ